MATLPKSTSLPSNELLPLSKEMLPASNELLLLVLPTKDKLLITLPLLSARLMPVDLLPLACMVLLPLLEELDSPRDIIS